MSNSFDKLLELKEKINIMEVDFIKACDKGNKSAGIRARKLLLEISKDCKNLRQNMLAERL